MNRNRKLFSGMLIVCCSFLVYSFTPSIANWPQFRGPENNMIATGTNYPTEWNDSLNVLWKTDLAGEGWSSPIVTGDKIFITSTFLEKAAPAEAKPTPPPPALGTPQGIPPPKAEDNSYTNEVYRWELTCIDLKSGKELWKQVAKTGAPGIKNTGKVLMLVKHL